MRADKDQEREDRIYNEAIVDCYDEYEQAAGWHCHLEDRLTFPFKGKCIQVRTISPLKFAEVVEVMNMADQDAVCMRCSSSSASWIADWRFRWHSFSPWMPMKQPAKQLATGIIGWIRDTSFDIFAKRTTNVVTLTESDHLAALII